MKKNRFFNKKTLSDLTTVTKRLLVSDTEVANANTPYEIVYTEGLPKLRYYPPLTGYPTKYKTPLLFIMPLAVTADIYDFLEDMSLIRFLLREGFAIYLTDWGIPTRKDYKLGFDHYVGEALPKLIENVRLHSGEEQISTHGWSMGGMFSMLYSAYSEDENIKNMILVGTPINGHAEGPVGQFSRTVDEVSKKVEKVTSLHPRMIPSYLLHSYGWVNSLAFKIVAPAGIINSYKKLLDPNIDEATFKENKAKNKFLNKMFDYPGEIVKHTGLGLWIENKILHGEFEVKGKLASLDKITANLLIISGSSDSLVTTDATLPILTMTNSTDVGHMEVTGGHVSIMSSRKNSEETWPVIAEWLKQRSAEV